jgi:hypothetical protein
VKVQCQEGLSKVPQASQWLIASYARCGLVLFLRTPGAPPGLRGAHWQLEGAARLTQAVHRRGGSVARWGDQTEVLFGRVVEACTGIHPSRWPAYEPRTRDTRGLSPRPPAGLQRASGGTRGVKWVKTYPYVCGQLGAARSRQDESKEVAAS